MSADLGGIKGKLTLDHSEFRAGIEGAEHAVEAFKETALELGAAMGVAFSVEKIVEFGKESVHAFAEAEHSAVLLDNAIKAQGFQSQAAHEDAKELAEALSHQSVQSHVAIESSERLLISLAHLTGEGLDKTERAAVNLAAGLGRDLQQTTMALAKAAEGNTTAFNKMTGAHIESGDGARALAEALEFVRANIGEAAAAELNTYAGRVAQFDHAMESLKENIGHDIAPELETLMLSWGKGAEAAARFIAGFKGEEVMSAKDELAAYNAVINDTLDHTHKATDEQFAWVAAESHLNERHLALNQTTQEENLTLLELRGNLIDVVDANEKLAKAAEENAKKHDAMKVAAEAAAEAEKKFTEEIKEFAKVAKEHDDAAQKVIDAQQKLADAAAKSSNDNFFDHLAASADPAAEAIHRAELALREFHDQMDRPGHIMTDDEKREAEDLNASLLRARGSMQSFKAEEHATSQETKLLGGAMQAAGSQIIGMALDGQTAAQTMKNLMRLAADEALKFAVQEVEQAVIHRTAKSIEARSTIASDAAAAAAAAAVPYAGIPGVGPALAAAASAEMYGQVIAYEGVVGLEGGGEVVGSGPRGRDSVPFMLAPGEGVVKTDTMDKLEHALNHGGFGGGDRYEFHFHGPTNAAELDRWIVDVFEPRYMRQKKAGRVTT